MAEQHLDYNARLISVRRHHNLSFDADCYDSARSSNVEDDVPEETGNSMEFVRSPGAVPFFWERAPGVAKAEIARARDLRAGPEAIGNLKPPPAAGRSFSPVPVPKKEEGEAIVKAKEGEKGMAMKVEEAEEEKLVETVKPASSACKAKIAGQRGRKHLEPVEEVVSTRAFAERVASRSFFGEIALSAIGDTSQRGTGTSPLRAARGARAAFGSGSSSSSGNLFFESPTGNFVPHSGGPDQNEVKLQRQAPKDLCTHASETSFPPAAYDASGLQAQRNRRAETDPDTRQYILHKFLPAAAGAVVTQRHVERASAKDAHSDPDPDRASRDHSSAPLTCSSPVGFSQHHLIQQSVHARPAPRFVAVKMTSSNAERQEGDDHGADNVSALASKMGCGLLPRVMGTPCFPFMSRAKAKNVKRIRSPAHIPSRSTTFEDDSQFDDAYSEFWDEEDEEEFLDRKLMEVRETEEQLKCPARNLPTGPPRVDFNPKTTDWHTVLSISSPSSGYTSSSLAVVQEDHVWLDKESESSQFSASSEPSVDMGPLAQVRDNATTFPVHHQDARGFLGLPRHTRAPEPELVPRRAAAYREYFHHDPGTASGKGSPLPAASEVQGRNRLEDFLRLERWNQPEAKDMDVQTWVNRSAGHVGGKEVDGSSEPQLSLSEEAEHAQSSRSSGAASFCGSEGLSFTSDPKSSDTSSGTGASTDQEDLAVKGWPLGALQTYQQRKWSEKESPVSVLPNSVPPLPSSPSESWLWANLAASPLNAQKGSQLVLSKKYLDHGGPANPETNSKWQLVVRSENSRASDRLRFSEELTNDGLLLGGDGGHHC
eukprot:TRINITY_DN14754_c0_g1_i1.p1 TRINITY_DN14754_c0_g1~~TRINITY_DN14754_c0_g1_i1.p1  ORF type:complete len:901 (-),score=136.97 TRINITY_DN14754_c0_g1_i1:307-2781(-)